MSTTTNPREEYKSEVDGASDGQFAGELLEVFYDLSIEDGDAKVKRSMNPAPNLLEEHRRQILGDEFRRRFGDTMESAARKAAGESPYVRDCFFEGGTLRREFVYEVAMSHLLLEVEDSWDTLPNFDPEKGSLGGFVYQTTRYKLLNYAPEEQEKKGHVHQPYANDPEQKEKQFTEEDTQARTLRQGPSVHGSGPNSGQAADTASPTRELARDILGDHLPENYDPDAAMRLAEELLRKIVKKERDNLGESQDGISYARVLEADLTKGATLDDLYEELQEEYGDGFVNRNTLRNWRMRAKNNLRVVLLEKYPEATELMPDVL